MEYADPEFESFYEAVMEIWPTTKITKGYLRPMWRERLKYFPRESIIVALNYCRLSDPDATKPSWSVIINKLRDIGGRIGRNDFQILLVNIRRALTQDRVKGVENWTDSEVFQNHIDANTRSITHSLDGRPHEDPDGRRAKLAGARRQRMAEEWREYLMGINEAVPEYLG